MRRERRGVQGDAINFTVDDLGRAVARQKLRRRGSGGRGAKQDAGALGFPLVAVARQGRRRDDNGEDARVRGGDGDSTAPEGNKEEHRHEDHDGRLGMFGGWRERRRDEDRQWRRRLTVVERRQRRVSEEDNEANKMTHIGRQKELTGGKIEGGGSGLTWRRQG